MIFRKGVKMERKDKINYYLDIAQTVAQRSTCLRRKYGAIIVKNDEVISTGYNGAPRGCTNCSDKGSCKREELNIPSGERYELCLAGDTVIKLLDGTYETIESLCNRNAEGVWVYSVNVETGEIVPAQAFNIHKTGVRKDIVEVVLDNGKSVKCTSDHLFLMRDGTYKEAQALQIEDSLMPMYYNFARNNGKYESISNTVNARKEKMHKNWISTTYQIPTHHLVYEFFYGAHDYKERDLLVHHKDENTFNNTPDNLELIGRGGHSLLHLETAHRINDLSMYSQQGRDKFIENLRTCPKKYKERQELGYRNMKKNWDDPLFRKRAMERNRQLGTHTCNKINKDADSIRRRGKSKVIKGLSLLLFDIRNNEINLNENNYEIIRDMYVRPLKEKGGIRFPSMKTILKYYPSFDDALLEARMYNHKVVEVRKLDVEIPVYDMTVPNYENFAVDLGDNSCIFVHNCRSVHAEQNAIISAARRDMVGATLYLSGLDGKTNKVLPVSEPCSMCKRFILNSGIEQVVMRNGKDYDIIETSVWRLLDIV